MQHEIIRKVKRFLQQNMQYAMVSVMNEKLTLGEMSYDDIADEMSFLYRMNLLDASCRMNRAQYAEWEALYAA